MVQYRRSIIQRRIVL